MRLTSDGGCLPFNGVMCEQCDIENKGPSTDFRYECFSNCDNDQWEFDCRQCDPGCRTCFGSDEYHCHSCFDNDYDFHLKGTTCVEECGDAKNMGDFECDDGNNIDGDGCT